MKYALALTFFLTSWLSACGKTPVAQQDPPTTSTGFENVRLYRADGPRKFFDDVDKTGLESTVAELKSRKPGEVTSLIYTRRTQFPQGSPWLGLDKVRSSSYAAAVKLLRDHGLSDPILVSVSQIEGYLKYYDDEWYAALEVALNQGIPGVPFGRSEMGAKILADLPALSSTNMNAKISGDVPALPLRELARTLKVESQIWSAPPDQLMNFWQRNTWDYKPLSFYVGDSLERAWISDRILIAPHADYAADDRATFNAYYNTEAAGARALKTLRQIFAHVTNKVDSGTWSDEGISSLINPARLQYAGPQYMFWPPSSPGVLERMAPGTRIGYDMQGAAQPPMAVIVNNIQSGSFSMRPRDGEGFMIYQRYAVEPLITFGQLPEAQIVQPSNEIQSLWKEVYEAASAKIQETNQKVIDTGSGATSCYGPAPARLWLEPLPSFFLRESQAYDYLASYAKTLPADFRERWLVEGQKAEDFFSRLSDQMLSLYVLSAQELGLKLDPAATARIPGGDISKWFMIATDFLENLEFSPAMNADQRFLAVQGVPGGSKSFNCYGKPATFWATVGVEAVPVHVSSNSWTPPTGGSNGESYEADMVVLVDHFNEINACVSNPLNRDEWRTILSESANTQELEKRLLEF